MIGIDGLEWDVVLPMLRAGQLPHMAELMSRGNYGHLRTIKPTSSPVIWTTVATGKLPRKHGIVGFADAPWPGGPPKLRDSRDRKTKAVWNIASDYGRRVAIVGWWMTFPVEPVNGVMIAQTNTVDQLGIAYGKRVVKGTLLEGVPGQVYPPSQERAVRVTMAKALLALPELTEKVFGRFEHPLSILGKRLWTNCKWSFRADAIYARLAEQFLDEPEDYDLLAVYFGGTDVVGHRFWRYLRPSEFRHVPTAEQIANFRHVIPAYYAYVDGVVGRLVARAGPNAAVIVLSDHGMKKYNVDQEFTSDKPPKSVLSANHPNAEPGVIIVAGPAFTKATPTRLPGELKLDNLKTLASVEDMTPVLLALLNVPLGQDMDGRLPDGLITPRFLARYPIRTVPTHDTKAWQQAHRSLPGRIQGHEERIQQLRSLGYITSQ